MQVHYARVKLQIQLVFCFSIGRYHIRNLLYWIIRMLRPVQVRQTIIHFVHADTFGNRTDQVAKIAADALLVNHRVSALAIMVLAGGNGLV